MREPAKKPPFKKSTLVLVSILFTLVVLEIGTRIWLAIIPEEAPLPQLLPEPSFQKGQGAP